MESINLNEELKKNEERVNKQITEEEKKFDETYGEPQTMEEVDSLLFDSVSKYLEDNPKERKKILERFRIKETKEIQENRKLRRFTPIIVSASLIVGGILGFEIKDFYDKYISPKLKFNTTYEKNYESIDEAPLEIKKAYVEEQYTKYLDKAMETGYENEEFENTVRRFISAANKESLDEKEINNAATGVSKLTINDAFDETIPFENSPLSGSYLDENGDIYIPVKDKSELNDTDILQERNGTLYRKGR